MCDRLWVATLSKESLEMKNKIIELNIAKVCTAYIIGGFKKEKDGMILGKWWSRKQQESISPSRQQLHWHGLSDGIILEL